MIRLLCCAVLLCGSLLALGACRKPEKERPPEPTAPAASARSQDVAHDAIERTREAEQEMEQAQDDQRAAIEAAGG